MSLSIDGLASGLNTSELIQQLIQIERRPIVMMQQRIQTHQQRLDAWRDVNMRLASLESRLSDLLLSSTYNGRAVTSSDAQLVSATAGTAAMPATYDIVVEQLASPARIIGAKIDKTGPLAINGTLTVRVGDDGPEVAIEITEEMALNEVAQAMNAAEDVKVRATVIDGRLVLETLETGSSASIVVGEAVVGEAGEAPGLLERLGLLSTQEGYREEPGQDAVFTINGIEIVSSSNVVTDVVDGVTFTLKALPEQQGKTVTIRVAQDIDGAVKKVKDFVDQLNSALQFMSSRLEKDAILQGDSALLRLQSSLRLALSDRVNAEGEFNHLGAIGLRFTREGVLEIDEQKLRDALAQDPDAVYKLFAADRERGDAFDGIARRTRELVRTYTQSDGIIANRREMFQNQIRTAEDSMKRLEMRLERQEERLYRQFGAMEQALAALQTQSLWLSTQLVQMSALTNVGR